MCSLVGISTFSKIMRKEQNSCEWDYWDTSSLIETQLISLCVDYMDDSIVQIGNLFGLEVQVKDWVPTSLSTPPVGRRRWTKEKGRTKRRRRINNSLKRRISPRCFRPFYGVFWFQVYVCPTGVTSLYLSFIIRPVTLFEIKNYIRKGALKIVVDWVGRTS